MLLWSEYNQACIQASQLGHGENNRIKKGSAYLRGYDCIKKVSAYSRENNCIKKASAYSRANNCIKKVSAYSRDV